MDIRNAGDRIMNTWLYPIEGGWVMIDTGYENSYQKVLKRLNKMLIQPEEELKRNKRHIAGIRLRPLKHN